jgi:hypothetical protein
MFRGFWLTVQRAWISTATPEIIAPREELPMDREAAQTNF